MWSYLTLALLFCIAVRADEKKPYDKKYYEKKDIKKGIPQNGLYRGPSYSSYNGRSMHYGPSYSSYNGRSMHYGPSYYSYNGDYLDDHDGSYLNGRRTYDYRSYSLNGARSYNLYGDTSYRSYDDDYDHRFGPVYNGLYRSGSRSVYSPRSSYDYYDDNDDYRSTYSFSSPGYRTSYRSFMPTYTYSRRSYSPSTYSLSGRRYWPNTYSFSRSSYLPSTYSFSRRSYLPTTYNYRSYAPSYVRGNYLSNLDNGNYIFRGARSYWPTTRYFSTMRYPTYQWSGVQPVG